MQACEIEIVEDALPPLEPVGWSPAWSALSQRVGDLSALLRVQAHAYGVPALAALLMQGLVL